MQLEEAIHMLKSYSRMSHKLTDNQGRPKLDQAIETVLQVLDNSIPKQTLEAEIERVKEERLNLKSRADLKHEILMQEDCKLLGEQKAYKKLLEGKQYD